MADADMSTSLLEITKFIPAIERDTHLIMGTRKGSSAILIKHQPWYREKMGEAYALLARLITGLTIRDFGCGFKVFSREAAQRIFSQLVTVGWVFDTEALYLAKRFHYTVEEVGISWKNDPQTRVHILTDIFKSVFDLMYMRFKHRSLNDISNL
jgi:dolichyl-phosphate beta-glucosyltransferase